MITILNFLKIRLLQLFRELKNIGLFRCIFVAGVLAYILWILVRIMPNSNTNCLIINAICGFILLIIQTKRQDSILISLSFSNFRLVYFAEYILFTLPIIILNIYYSNIYINLGYIIYCYLITFLPQIKTKSMKLRFMSKLINPKMFEISSFVRQYFIILIISLIISTIFSKYTVVVPIFIFFTNLMCTDIFKQCEPFEMIVECGIKYNKIISYKLLKTIQYYLMYVSIPIIGFLIFNIEYWYVILVLILLGILNLIILLSAKYAKYYIGKEENSGAYSLYTSISIFLIFLIPISIILAIILTIKANKNLKQLLNVDN
ncbi:MAG: hypothetical protein MJ211_00625 [Bacteroidales bacterium]|nr:hypothetical protein [Bacteroidales bacterium]